MVCLLQITFAMYIGIIHTRRWPLGRTTQKNQAPDQSASNSTNKCTQQANKQQATCRSSKRITAQFGPQRTSTGSCSLPEISVDTSMVEAWRFLVKNQNPAAKQNGGNDKRYIADTVDLLCFDINIGLISKWSWKNLKPTNKLVFGRSWCSVFYPIVKNHSESEKNTQFTWTKNPSNLVHSPKFNSEFTVKSYQISNRKL